MDLLGSGTCSQDCDSAADTGRFLLLVAIAMSVAAFAFVRSTWTGVLGQTDNCWNVLPAVYSWLLYWLLPTERGLVAAVLVTLWSARLSYNFARKNGFWEEDYRWAHMRSWFSKFGFCCFNFWFISICQNFFIIGFTLPAYVATLYPTTSLNAIDAIAGVFMFAFIVLEGAADQQQWNYQSAKKLALKESSTAAEVYKRGFLKEGMFRYSRHPNFFAEIALWWAFYGFSVAATGRYCHWSSVGVIVLTLIFHGSADLTEKISSSKYSLYSKYQQETSRIIPWFPNHGNKDE